jgi:hypothetical protein
MTTSTPLFCGAALFRHHATGGTLQIGGDWSIRLLRSNQRLLAGVSHTISFAAAHVSALARTRRPRGPSICAGGVWVVVPCIEEIHLGERGNTRPENIRF